jgi:hypothetical protein
MAPTLGNAGLGGLHSRPGAGRHSAASYGEARTRLQNCSGQARFVRPAEALSADRILNGRRDLAYSLIFTPSEKGRRLSPVSWTSCALSTRLLLHCSFFHTHWRESGPSGRPDGAADLEISRGLTAARITVSRQRRATNSRSGVGDEWARTTRNPPRRVPLTRATLIPSDQLLHGLGHHFCVRASTGFWSSHFALHRRGTQRPVKKNPPQK